MLAGLRSSHDNWANAGTGALIGGGALLAAGLMYGLWATFATPSEHVSVGFAPVISPTSPAGSPAGGIFVAHGTF